MSTQMPRLLARSLRSVRHDEATGEWIFDFGDGYFLRVASPWRLVKGGAIAVGREDHRQKFGLPEPVDAASAVCDLLKNHVIVDAVAAEGSADLSLDFGAGIRLEVFNNSSGFEGWILDAPDGRTLVAQGGGTLTETERRANAPTEVDPTDWRLQGQERYLKRATLVRRAYRRYAKNPYWDHDHCEFCSAKFTVEALPDTLQEGYATLDDYHWVCPTCFEDFKDLFAWTVSPTRGRGDA
jgi:Family of unknown function (DUF6188)